MNTTIRLIQISREALYISNGKMKIEIGVGKGKKNYDKRDSIAKKDQQREAQKEFKIRNLG